METYGSLWKMRDQSIDKYVSDGQSGLKSQTEAEQEDRIGRKELVSGAVRDNHGDTWQYPLVFLNEYGQDEIACYITFRQVGVDTHIVGVHK